MADRSATVGWAAGPEDDGPEYPTVPGYEILAVLGRGGMGVVYKARQLEPDRLVALKVIRGGALAGPQERARFRAEAEAAARVRHPNVVAVFDVGTHHGLPYLAMELVDGASLDRRLAAGPLPVPEAAELIRTLAGALQQAHDTRIIHRDLKPANILLSPDGPKVVDFGLAKRLDTDSTALTRDGVVLGTAGYMAPEQAAGGGAGVGPATDVYALGAVLFEALTGRPPFQADSWGGVIDQVLRSEPTPPAMLNPTVPPELETICLKCLEKEPQRRYGRADELAADLTRFLAGRPVLAVPLPDDDRLARAAAAEGFTLLGEVGRGPHAVVYRAAGPFGVALALKVFPRGGALREEWQAWFDESAGRWAAGSHPHVLLPTRRGWLGDRPFIAQEYVPQGSVASQFGGLPRPLIPTLRLAVQLTEVINYLHRQGLVHGNLKPSNVLLAADGIPRVADPRPPGKLLRAEVTDPRGGEYLAPELADDRAEPRPHTDVYGLVAVLYGLLTGRPPVPGIGSSVDGAGGPTDLTPPSALRSDVSPELDWVCARGLRADPWRRTPRAYDLLRRLRPLLKAAEDAEESARRPRHRPLE